MRPIRRFTLAMAVVALVLYATDTVRSDEPAPVLVTIPVVQDTVVPPAPAPAAVSGDDQPMLIIPATKLNTVTSNQVIMSQVVADPANGVPAAATFSREEYQRVYNAIPFSRSEYKANPNYRHDTAMEILTGNPRTQTVVNHNHEHKQPVKRIPPPSRPSRPLTPFSGYSYFWGNSFLRGWWF